MRLPSTRRSSEKTISRRPAWPVASRTRSSRVSCTVASRLRIGVGAAVVQHGVLERQRRSVSPRSVKTKLIVELLAVGLRAVQARRHRGEEAGRAAGGAAGPRRRGGSRPLLCDAVAQLERAGEVHVAPRARLGLIAELIVGAREQLARRVVVRARRTRDGRAASRPSDTSPRVERRARLVAAPRRRRPSPRRTASPPRPAAAGRGAPGCRRTSRSSYW